MKDDLRGDLQRELRRFSEGLRLITESVSNLAGLWAEILLAAEEVSRTPRSMTRERDALMTIKEVAAYLKVTPRTVQQWIAEKGLPVRRAGDDPRFDLAEVDEWTTRHRKTARTAAASNGKVRPLQKRLQARS